MPDIVTATTGKKTQGTGSPKITVTRSSTRSATSNDDPGRDAMRLGIAVVATLGGIMGILLLGSLGHHAGFAHVLGIPGLQQSMGQAMLDGLLIPTALARGIFNSGVRNPLLFTGSMVFLLPIIAGLAIARPRRRGTAPTGSAIRLFAGIGATLILIVDVLIGIRIANSTQASLIMPESLGNQSFDDWFKALEGAAAVDAVATIAAVMLAVLAFRLPIDHWARALLGTITISIAVVTFAAVAATGGALHGFDRNRPLLRNELDQTILLIGSMQSGAMVLIDEEHMVREKTMRPVILDMSDSMVSVPGRESLRGFITDSIGQTDPDPRP